MAGDCTELEHPKKRRRRFYHEKPLSARLSLDDSLPGDAGLVDEDLWTKLIALGREADGMSSPNFSKARRI
jgi:hypothetical protein